MKTYELWFTRDGEDRMSMYSWLCPDESQDKLLVVAEEFNEENDGREYWVKEVEL